MSDATLTSAERMAPDIGRLRLRLKRDARRLALTAAIIGAGAGAALYAHDWWTTGRFMESTDDAYVGGDVTAIAPHVAGFVAEIAVVDNQFVRKGQVLMRLDERDFRASLDRAEAGVQERQAALSNLQAKSVLQRSLIGQAEADLSAKEAQAVFARDNDLRYQGLERIGAISRQDAQRALAANRQGQSGVASSRAGVAAANQQRAVLQTEIDQARAELAQADADLRTARLNLGYTEIRSPVDGYVGNRAVHVGAYVAAGAYLASIIPAGGLWVDANFKESQLGRLHPGLPVSVAADVLPGEVFHGRVASIAPATGAQFSVLPPENATGNFTKIVQRVPVRILLEDGASQLGRLRPGLSVTAEIDTRKRSGQ
jgi:membrane fusion protein (multidrug efflux system)